MSQELVASYHARGKPLPATVGHVSARRPIAARSELLKDGRSGERAGRRYVTAGRATVWRERRSRASHVNVGAMASLVRTA